MSATMRYRRKLKAPNGVCIDRPLHSLLALRFFGHDGSLSSAPRCFDRNTEALMAYLEGLRDANVKGAQELLTEIIDHPVEIWIDR